MEVNITEHLNCCYKYIAIMLTDSNTMQSIGL